MKTDTITAGALKQRTRDALDRAQAGESMTITRHGRPVARLVPYSSEDASGRPAEAAGVSGVDGAAEGGQGPVWLEVRPYLWSANTRVGEKVAATISRWMMWGTAGLDPEAEGCAPDLAANIRAATAAWNKRHPDRPAVVPEQFRDDNDKARKGGESEG